MTEESDPWTWNEQVKEFQLRNARIVATLGKNKGAIVESVKALLCWEGRIFSYEVTEEGPLHTLDYGFGFGTIEETDPMSSTSVPGRIIITGVHSNGLSIEIRGDGWIGYDEGGRIEGRFDEPPVIISENPDPDEELSDIEKRLLRPPIHPMPPQFNAANRQVPAPVIDFGVDG